jgi:hypothetical protein
MARGSLARLGMWDWAFLGVSALSVVLLAWLGRSTTFWFDDWVILGSPSREGWTLDALMLPHNDHWQLTQILVWKVLQATVGLRSHLPYLLPTLLAHVGAAIAVYVLARRQAGPFIAFAVGVLFLLLGTAGEVFFFAAAFNLVAATALGAWALVVALPADPLVPIGRRRSTAVAVLLLVAVMSGGPGLFYLPAVAIVASLVPGRRRELWVVLPAALAFVGWELAYGGGASTAATLGDVSALRALGDYVRTGVAHAMGAVTGLEDQVGLILAVALLGATAWHLLGHRPLRVAAVAGAAGLVSAFAVTGLARAQFGAEQATAARYVYTAAPFVLLMACAWLGTLAPIEARRPRVALTVSVVLAVALVANLTGIRWWQQFFLERATETRAAVAVLLRYGGSTAIPADLPIVGRADLRIEGLPTPGRLADLVERYGSPLDDPLSGTTSIPPEMEERALLWLVDPAFRVDPADGLPDGLGLPEFAGQTDVTAAVEGSCARVTPSGVAPSVTVRVPSGAVLHVLAEGEGTLGAALSRSGTFRDGGTRTLDVPAGGAARVLVPDLGDGSPWLVHLTLPTDDPSLVCVAPAA